ncbi:MAG: hypothetical protein J5792_08205 [Bacteroidales bacterium]|nr:hypothetical protein [Bacteroidales bacterium]
MKDKTKKILIDIKQSIFGITCVQFAAIFFCCWFDIEDKTLSEFMEHNDSVRRGFAEFVSIRGGGKGGADFYYDLYDEKGVLMSADCSGGNVTRWAPGTYLGCRYVLYYNAIRPSSNFHICFDSLILDTPPQYKTVAYVKQVAFPDLSDLSIVTIKWKTATGKWNRVEQAVNKKCADKYVQYKKNKQPVECYVYKTSGGYLAHIF